MHCFSLVDKSSSWRSLPYLALNWGVVFYYDAVIIYRLTFKAVMSKPSNKVPASWLGLVLSPQCAGATVVALATQARQSGLRVLLAGCSVRQVFADPDILTALRAGMFERVLLSTDEQFLATDALDAIKCLPDASVWLTWLRPDSNIPLIADSWQQPVTSDVLTAMAGAEVLAGAVSAFRPRTLPRNCPVQQMLSALLTGSQPAARTGSKALLQQSLFVSAAGVARFGGLQRFLSLPFYQGELWQGDIADCWQLGADHDIDVAAKLLPLFIACDDGSTILLDLLPAQHAGAMLWHQLSVPRMVLSLRRLPDFTAMTPPDAGLAVFAMSLYNKAGYLQQALYSVAMQSYSQVALHVIDDGSSDGSVARLQQFQALAPSTLPLQFEHSGGRRGTYSIRNRIIANWQQRAGSYLVQDADDISSIARAWLQLARLQQDDQAAVCIADMVRIDSAGQPLTLDGLAERYGSATLCAPVALHQQLGYYENICKNADSEFIDRLKAIKGKAAASWYRYPVLYQRYDGNNLTADMYQHAEHQLLADHSVRARHKQLYQMRHQLLSADEAVRGYRVDTCPSADYKVLLNGFVPPVFALEAELCATGLGVLFQAASAAGITTKITRQSFTIQAMLEAGKHQYLYAPDLIPAANFRQQHKNTADTMTLPLFVDATYSDKVLLVLLYLDKDGNKLGHEFFAPATNLQMQLPAQCDSIKLGWRLSGEVTVQVQALRLAHQPLNNLLAVPASDYLLITNHYPSDDSLYRNAFVHSRVKGYAEQGVKVDVFRSRPKAPLSFHQFDGVQVVTGCPSLLLPGLTAGKYKHVLVHFLDSAIWQVLKQVVAAVPVTVWLHGAEVHSAQRRRFNYPDDAGYAAALVQSERRLQFWREVLQPCPAKLHLVFVSQHFATEVLTDLALDPPLPGNRYRVLANPINTRLFAYQPKQLSDRKKILVLRPFSSAQYANDLAVAAVLLLKQQPEFNELDIAVMGEGVLFDELTRPLLGLANVRLQRGFLPQPQIAALHRDYGVFLCPTRWDSQGVSRDEAMASGLVVVTNAVAAVPEFCDDNSAMLCEPESPEALAAALLTLVRDPALYLRLSANGATRVAQRGTALMIKQELALFHTCAE